jgi:hypothetical protein
MLSLSALLAPKTGLILIESKGDEVPFDLKTDRYLAIESKPNALEREEQNDIWVDISVQDSGFDFY